MSAASYPPERAALLRIQDLLARWELEQLNQHIADLHDFLESAQYQRDEDSARATRLEKKAEYWREQAFKLKQQLAGDVRACLNRQPLPGFAGLDNGGEAA
jgi:hypothetical protein